MPVWLNCLKQSRSLLSRELGQIAEKDLCSVCRCVGGCVSASSASCGEQKCLWTAKRTARFGADTVLLQQRTALVHIVCIPFHCALSFERNDGMTTKETGYDQACCDAYLWQAGHLFHLQHWGELSTQKLNLGLLLPDFCGQLLLDLHMWILREAHSTACTKLTKTNTDAHLSFSYTNMKSIQGQGCIVHSENLLSFVRLEFSTEKEKWMKNVEIFYT